MLNDEKLVAKEEKDGEKKDDVSKEGKAGDTPALGDASSMIDDEEFEDDVMRARWDALKSMT